MKKADQKLLIGIAIGATAAFVFMRHMAAQTQAPVRAPLPGTTTPGSVLPQQIKARAQVGRYTRRGRAMLAKLHAPQHNYLKQPGYPMPGWMV